MEFKEALIDFCEGNELEYRTDYSGRCMYGRTCFAIVCDSPLATVMQLVEYLKDAGFADVYYELGEPRMDNMGLSQVVYFPKYLID